jgi:hypothetical protein
MMKKKIISITGICIALLFIYGSGCKKMVDVGDPTTTITTEKAFTTDGTAYAALAGLYSYLLNGDGPQAITLSNGGTTVYAGMSGDELTNFLGTGNDIDYNFVSNKLTSQNDLVNGVFWTPLYKSIYNANSIIEGVAASTSNLLKPAARKQITAEAKFIRAFNYFYLVNLFGDVPLVTGIDWKANAQVPRTPLADVYTQIINDLLDAQRDLPEDYAITGGERIRVNKYVATAMLARVYLYRNDWKNAEAQASAVIANSQFDIDPNLDNVFLPSSKESIWQLKPASTNINIPSYEAKAFTPQMSWEKDVPEDLRPLYLDPTFFSDLAILFFPSYYMTDDLSAAFEIGDKRLKAWTNFVETPNSPPYTGATVHFPSKYARQGLSATQYLVVLRLAEQVLIRAEARAQQGNLSGADEDLNKIRMRAGLGIISSASKDNALAAIAHERRVEFFSEWGHRWFDLKRTGKALEVLGALPYKKIIATQLLYPIPLNELQSAPSLVQNPGY